MHRKKFISCAGNEIAARYHETHEIASHAHEIKNFSACPFAGSVAIPSGVAEVTTSTNIPHGAIKRLGYRRAVMGKLLFKSNFLQLFVTDVKKVINYFTFYKISKVKCYNYNYFSKVKKLLFCYIHLAAECGINSNNDTILQKSNKSLQSASGSHMSRN